MVVTIDHQIALLESTKTQLLRQRQTLADKIVEVKDKAKKREDLERERVERRKKLADATAMK